MNIFHLDDTKPDWPYSLQGILLMLVLMVATAYRFYGIDNAGLWGNELTNAAYVANTGWFSMMSSVIYKDINPPGYITLLYLQYEILGSSEFALRFLSAIAGIGSVLMLVLLGKRCTFPQAGYLAATLLAGAPLALMYSQEAQTYSVFAFFVLMQCYCFLGLFTDSGEPGDVGYPAPDAMAVRIKLFWISTLLMFLMSYASIAFVLGEMIAFRYLLWANREPGKKAPDFRAVFIPVMGAGLLWLPIALIHINKVWPLLDWGWFVTADTKDLLAEVVGYQVVLQVAVLVALAGFFLCFAWRFLSSRLNHQESLLVAISLIMVTGIVVITLAKCVMVWVQFRPLWVAFQPFIFLLASVVFFLPWFRPADSISRWYLLVILLVLLVVDQVGKNYNAGLFNAKRKPDLRPAIKILLADTDFMRGGRAVFMSDASVGYYLNRYRISRHDHFVVDKMRVASKAAMETYLDDGSFYYIDVIDNELVRRESALLKALALRYGVVCMSSFDSARLVKFSEKRPPAGMANVESCADIVEQEKPLHALSPLVNLP